MKREIIFRGKRVDNGEWVEGYYGIKGKGADLEQHVIMTDTLGNGSIPYFYFTDIVVDPETVGQYTGLTDKNGVKIFEGDMLTWYSGMMSIDGLSDEIKTKASKTLKDWESSNKSTKYDWEKNGWYKVFKVGVCVFYNGSFSIHNDYDTSEHNKNSKYNGTTYYGNINGRDEIRIIGNIHENPELLKPAPHKN